MYGLSLIFDFMMGASRAPEVPLGLLKIVQQAGCSTKETVDCKIIYTHTATVTVFVDLLKRFRSDV